MWLIEFVHIYWSEDPNTLTVSEDWGRSNGMFDTLLLYYQTKNVQILYSRYVLCIQNTDFCHLHVQVVRVFSTGLGRNCSALCLVSKWRISVSKSIQSGDRINNWLVLICLCKVQTPVEQPKEFWWQNFCYRTVCIARLRMDLICFLPHLSFKVKQVFPLL